MSKKITLDDFKSFRLDLNHKIEKALLTLKWDRMRLAEAYGNYKKEDSYSRARMTQLVNVHAGHEDCAKEMYDWMLEKIKEFGL